MNNKPIKDWTLAECKAYCEEQRMNCDCGSCLLLQFCGKDWENAPFTWNIEVDSMNGKKRFCYNFPLNPNK